MQYTWSLWNCDAIPWRLKPRDVMGRDQTSGGMTSVSQRHPLLEWHDKMTLDSSHWLRAASDAYQAANQSFHPLLFRWLIFPFQNVSSLPQFLIKLEILCYLLFSSFMTWSTASMESPLSRHDDDGHIIQTDNNNRNNVGMCYSLSTLSPPSLSVHLPLSFRKIPSSWFFHHFLSILFLSLNAKRVSLFFPHTIFSCHLFLRILSTSSFCSPVIPLLRLSSSTRDQDGMAKNIKNDRLPNDPWVERSKGQLFWKLPFKRKPRTDFVVLTLSRMRTLLGSFRDWSQENSMGPHQDHRGICCMKRIWNKNLETEK